MRMIMAVLFNCIAGVTFAMVTGVSPEASCVGCKLYRC